MNNIDKQKLINTILASSGGKLDKNSVEKAASGDASGILSSLNEQDRKKLSEALSDKEKAKQVLSSDAAKQLLKSLSGK